MRAVLQRVDRAKVTVESVCVGEIPRGLLVLLGVEAEDGPPDLEFMLRKLPNLRIFEDREGKMNRSLLEIGGAILLVSQFTLFGDCRKGNRPSFSRAAPPDRAEELYHALAEGLRSIGILVATGQFQAMMKVELVNDGPVTVILDSKKADY